MHLWSKLLFYLHFLRSWIVLWTNLWPCMGPYNCNLTCLRPCVHFPKKKKKHRLMHKYIGIKLWCKHGSWGYMVHMGPKDGHYWGKALRHIRHELGHGYKQIYVLPCVIWCSSIIWSLRAYSILTCPNTICAFACILLDTLIVIGYFAKYMSIILLCCCHIIQDLIVKGFTK